MRHKTRQIKVGSLKIGGGAPIVIQSMAKTDTNDIDGTVCQIKELEKAGCEIVRVAVRDIGQAKAIKTIKKNIKIPLVSDIHFDYRLALEAINSGADKIRLNPGNIYKEKEIKEVAKEAKKANVPIRVGVNSGSVRGSMEKRPFGRCPEYREKRPFGRCPEYREKRPFGRCPEQRGRSALSGAVQNTNGEQARACSKGEGAPFRALSDTLVNSALDYIKVLEKANFYDIIVSLKASSVLTTIEAYRKFAKKSDYPLHLGITATGPAATGLVKSSIGLGVLLLEGIGDTIRVSLTANPCEEVVAAKNILQALDIRSFGLEVISCPTCGRCQVDLESIVAILGSRLQALGSRDFLETKKSFKIAIMGCEVNGPGEAKEADIGVACGRKSGVIFKKGKILYRVKEEDIVESLLKEMKGR